MIDDLRYAVKRIMRERKAATLIIVMLGLGIGINAAVFSVLDATVLNPFPYEDPDRIVEIVRGGRQRFSGAFNYRAFAALRDNNDVFQNVAGYRDGSVTITTGELREVRSATEVSADVFALLGVQPVLGRVFTRDEQGSGRNPAVIISHQLWETLFASDPAVVGETLRVDGEERTIIGVMPRGFTFYQAASVWLPLPVDASTPADDPYRFGAIARLREDVSLPEGRAAVDAMREALEPLFAEPTSDSERNRMAVPLRVATLAEGWNPAGLQYVGALFQLVAGFVLLVLCANLASLLLARGVSRQPELAVRQALGAPRGRLVRQLFAEHLLLAVAGGALGVPLAKWGAELLGLVLSSPVLTGVEIEVNVRVLAFVAGIAGFAAIAFGLMPAVELSRPALGAALGEWGAGATGPRRIRRRERALAIVQIAMALMLLIGAAMTARSLAALRSMDPGFDAERVFQILVPIPREYESDDTRRADLMNRFIEGLESVAGIEAIGWGAYPGEGVIGDLRDRRGFVDTADGPSALSARNGARAVNDDYFRAFGLEMLRGRAFGVQDRRGTAPVAILSDRAARLLWPDGDAVGKTMHYPGADAWLTVVGVVSDRVRIWGGSYDRSEWGMRAETWPDVYLAASQYDLVPSNLLWVRPRGDAAALSGIMRSAVSSAEPGLPAPDVRTVWEGEYEPSQFAYRIVLQVVGAVGLVAFLLSALGTYSVLSHVWTQRVRELGVRVALGATPRDVFYLVMGFGHRIALFGILGGTLASFVVFRVASGLFFGIASWDPIAYVGVAVALLMMTTAAGLAPARRATRTDCAAALRRE